MAINAQGYYEHLKNYLNLACYGKTCLASEERNRQENQLVLSEKIEGTNNRRKVLLNYNGDAFAIKLDQGNDPLFHFLNSNGHLWSRRCDFIVFQNVRSTIFVYCIEFKEASTRIPVDQAMIQLKAAEAWCISLNKIIAAYTDEKKSVKISKYLFTACQNPDPDLDQNNKYLMKYPSIRHYLFTEVDGTNLDDLENSSINTIR